jgi:zinc protease
MLANLAVTEGSQNRFMINQLRRCSICLLLIALVYAMVPAQSAPEPVREQLLNGLTILFSQRNEPNVLLKLRVHSGAAFDLAGKGGTMSLLGDILFPDPATREYISEQLGGKLDVSTDYDAIEVTISGKSSDFERLVEFLRAALISTQITPENVVKVRDARIKQLSSEQNASSEADRAVAIRLFGAFPYGHPIGGTTETVARIERSDLLLARERFLNADNATIAVIGGVDKARVMRTLRQLIGPWQKGDRSVPATFRPPNPIDTRALLLDKSGPTAEIRLAVRGLARSSADELAASVLARIIRDRWQTSLSDSSSVVVRHEAHTLPGAFVLSAAVPPATAAKAVTMAQAAMRSLATSGPTQPELDRARSAELADLTALTSGLETIADLWLDTDAYRLPALSVQLNLLRSLNAADIQRVAAKLFTDAPMALVVVGDSVRLKNSFGERAELGDGNIKPKTAVDSMVPIKKP